MRTRFRSVAVGLSILSVCCLWCLARLSGATGTIELAVTGRRNATPTIAADGRFVAVAWGGAQASGATDVFAAVSRDGGTAFGAPVRVNNIDGDARLNGEQPPHVALVRRAPAAGDAVVAAWTSGASASIQVRRIPGSPGSVSEKREHAPSTRNWQ